jgi:polar amino acid transport system substrate-binding protein
MQRATSTSNTGSRSFKTGWSVAAAILALIATSLASPPASGDTLSDIRAAGKVVLGYRTDARPFSYEESAGTPAGFSIALCERIAAEIKNEIGASELAVEWTPVTLEERFAAVQQGKIDLFCGADTANLSRRKDVSFSIPIYPGGIGALVRSDAPAALREVLAGQPSTGPLWRGSPARFLNERKFSVVAGTSGETWLADRMAAFKVAANVVPAQSYAEGLQHLLDRSADVFFGDRAILLGAAAGDLSAGNLLAIGRTFTSEPIALTLARNNDDLRLIVDRTLSRLFASAEFYDLYVKWFGEPDESTLTFYRQSALPE